MKFSTLSIFSSALLSGFATAQLSGTVGPTTTTAEKAATKVCNILDYGGVASTSTDNAAAIESAWAACVDGGEVYIPAGLGELNMIDGRSTMLIRDRTADGNMIYIEHTTDFELYSSTSAGAVQGYGYVFHADGTYGPRILRLYEVTDFSVHDLALVDSPAFHFTMDTCTNGEVYNMIIRGGNEGGLDGIDVWGTNIWIHDVEVTNKDECVTVKSPASYILVESIYCNWSGGCAIGSLGVDTAISYIEYNHIYTQNSNQMLMIKSNGGSGSVTNCQFNNFMGHTNAYTLDIDGYWTEETLAAGDGVTFSSIVFNHWHGTCSDGATRAPIQALCPAGAPCTDITIENFYIWTESGDEVLYKCENAYGSGGCLNTGSGDTSYAETTMTVTSVASYTITTMTADLTAGFALTASIPIPTVPTTFFPGLAPSSARLG
ncbi:hypothetical protein G7Y89_g13834 [Cudoniella acicularis]|uniref:Rhamnogalacturonase A n=1 Tax=Cudoniella acicularis TaxID=354080 RepID=A0A8H4R9W6_9HELO|nr:hypothetical protein G7Y89_g13834 [Cudoniella acicularis]